jgi:hypothetical protein
MQPTKLIARNETAVRERRNAMDGSVNFEAGAAAGLVIACARP